jgi:acyl carrier protein
MPADQPQEQSTDTRREELARWIVAWLSRELSIPPENVSRNRTFASHGMDSVRATMLVGDLEERLGQRLSPVLPWDYPDVDSMSLHLAEKYSFNPVAPSRMDDAALLAMLDDLSEEEVDRLLAERLNPLKG